MLLGESALVCESCWAARARDLKDAEQALIDGGFEIVHVSEDLDDGWLHGRYHVHKDGCCYKAHSYRDDAVRGAFSAMGTTVTTSCYAQRLERITS